MTDDCSPNYCLPHRVTTLRSTQLHLAGATHDRTLLLYLGSRTYIFCIAEYAQVVHGRNMTNANLRSTPRAVSGGGGQQDPATRHASLDQRGNRSGHMTPPHGLRAVGG